LILHLVRGPTVPFAKMIGEDYYFETANPEKDLFDKFSNDQLNKLLLDLDETRTRDAFSNSEILKNMITSEFFNYQ
jgi:hypothetical protein